MANNTPHIKVATSNKKQFPAAVTRTLTRRESELLSQINELKEKLVLAEISMDEKDVRIARITQKCKQQKKHIDQFDSQVEEIKLKNLDVTDKFYRLKSVANRATDIAREKNYELKSIEKALEKHQNELVVSKRIQAQLTDLLVKQAVNSLKQSSNKETKKINSSSTKVNKKQSSEQGFVTKLKVEPNIISSYLKNKLKVENKELSYFKNIEQKAMSLVELLKLKFKRSRWSEYKIGLKKKKTSDTNATNKSETHMPQIKWRSVNKQLPSRTGLFYVTDGTNVEIALFNADTQKFNQTDSNIAIDFWCLRPKDEI